MISVCPVPCPKCLVRDKEFCFTICRDKKQNIPGVHPQRQVLFEGIIGSEGFQTALISPSSSASHFMKDALLRLNRVLFPEDYAARGSGHTARGMLLCPKGAVYVWCNDKLRYPGLLKDEIFRHDLRIVSPDWLLSGENVLGHRKLNIAFDHAFGKATELSNKHWDAFHLITAN